VTIVEPEYSTAAQRSTGGVWATTTSYVLVTVVSLIGACLALLVGGAPVLALIVFAVQLVFLVPLLRRNIKVQAVWVMAGVALAATALMLLYLGSYFVVGLISPEVAGPAEAAWAIAALIAACSPVLALSAGAVVVGLGATTPPRLIGAVVVGVAMTLIIVSANLVAVLAAP
jgi:hypothetical protein